MIDIITVSTHDAKKTASDLARLLEAEEHRVRLIIGRQSEIAIPEAKESLDAVLIIWSEDAPSQTYMREWLRQIDASRLVEVATAPGWPERRDRKAPVIDFTNWRGERGGRAWNALNERLRQVTRVIEPPKPPPRHAALALGLASVAAVGVAMGVRLNDSPLVPTTEEQTLQTVQLEAPTQNVGGAVYAVEPASMDDLATLPPIRPLRIAPIEMHEIDFYVLRNEPIPEVRDPTLMERLSRFNPLGGNGDEDESGG
jgi:hypothetical protein